MSHFYVIAPREWGRMDYEVRTLDQLDPGEITDAALAQVLCYGVKRRVGERVLDERDLYRICVQDHRVLDHVSAVPLRALMLYVLTHELVHVVRFGQRLQRLDLHPSLRGLEEASVDRTARLILREVSVPGLGEALERIPAPDA